MRTLDKMGVFIALCLLLPPAIASPQIDCFMDNEECEITADNLIHMYTNVTSADECKLLCEDNVPCIAFSPFGEESPHFDNDCLLFSSCVDRRPCKNCMTGSSQTECICSIGYAGVANGDNVVTLIGSVADEHACKMHCITNDLCDVYTYFDSIDPTTPEVCFLLSSSGLQTPIAECTNCKSGAASCNVGQKCKAAVLLNDAEKDCYVDLNIVAIGGGEYYIKSKITGAGSGYVEQLSVRFNTTSTLKAQAGEERSNSYVVINGNSVLMAGSGWSSDASSGRDGYCGGGGGSTTGSWGGHGGVDGGDGEGGPDMNNIPGGKGSGLDLKTFPMKHFNLEPGAGGRNGGIKGGNGVGGGGVIINGRNPRGSYVEHGQGFGGGGGPLDSSYNHAGSPGCVLIEM